MNQTQIYVLLHLSPFTSFHSTHHPLTTLIFTTSAANLPTRVNKVSNYLSRRDNYFPFHRIRHVKRQ